MRFPILPFAFLSLLLFSLPGPPPATASPTPADTALFCPPIDFDRWERDRPAVAAKSLADLPAAEPGTVRLVYFLPSDRPFRGAVVDSMKSVMHRIQGFYREQMQGHGFGESTFPLETDAGGEPLVHRVDGQHPEIHYEEDTFKVLDEVGPAFDPRRNVYIVVVDNSNNLIGNGGVYSGGAGSRRGKNGGVGLFPAGAVASGSWELAAHELGHAFGLYHDFNDDSYIMSYGESRGLLSACNAEFLAAHPYFGTVEGGTGAPSIVLTSPTTYPEGAESVPIQLEVSAPDGLHQVMLFVRTVGNQYRREGLDFAVGFLEVKACRGLSGETRARVAFDYDGVIPSGGFTRLSDPAAHPIVVRAVDRDGDVGSVYGELVQASSYHIATHETEEVTSTALSPDGSTLALGRQDSRVELRDLATGSSSGFLGNGHSGGVYTVAFSPDGSILASGADDAAIRLWDVATGSLVAALDGHPYGIATLLFSPDGKSLASSEWWDDTIKLWDVATSTNTDTLEGSGLLAFSRDGRTLASGSLEMGIKLWEVATGTERLAVPMHDPWITALTISPDGSKLAVGSPDGGIKLWDTASGQHLNTLDSGVVALAWSADGRTLVSGSSSGEVELWDMAGGTKLAALGGHTERVHFVAFRPDGSSLVSASNSYMSSFAGSSRFLRGASDETIKLWNVSEWMGLRPQTLEIVSGDGQQGQPGEDLAEPFVVEVKDQNEDPLPNVEVTFRVVAHDGRLGGRFTVEKVTTDADGQASSRLTLGPDPGRNRVEAEAGGLTVTLGSVGLGTPMPVMDGDPQTWHLPHGAVARLGKGAFHMEGDQAVAFTPDGRCLAVGSLTGIWLHDAATARAATLLPLAEEVHSLAFSSDGSLLVSVSSRRDEGAIAGTIRLWDLATGRSLGTFLEGYVSPMRSVALSPDGTLLAAGVGDEVRLWDVATRTSTGILEGHEGRVQSVAFSPDGTRLAAAAEDRTIRLWEVSSGRIATTVEGHGGAVRSVAFAPDGASLASGADDRTVRLWDVPEGRSLAILTGHKGAVLSVSFSPDGASLVSGSEDETVRLWDVAEQAATVTLEGHASWVRTVAFSPDGRAVASAGTWDGKVNLWDLASGSAAVLDDYTGRAQAVSFSPDGTVLASGLGSGLIELWDVLTATRRALLAGHGDRVWAVAFSPDGRMLASGSEDRTVRLWDLETGTGRGVLEGHTGRVASVAFSPDGTTLASGSYDGSIKLWDAATGGHLANLEGHGDRVTSVIFSSDGGTLASGSFDQTVQLWELETRTSTATLEGHAGRVRSVSLSPDGKTLASGSDDWTIKLWDVTTGESTATLEGHEDVVSSVAFTPDGASLVSGSWDNTVKLWDAATEGAAATLEGHRSGINSISASSDGMTFASAAGDGLVFLWDLQRVRSHPRTLSMLSGDGQQAAPGTQLREPLVVSVRDQNGDAYSGAVVTFAVTGGDGTLSAFSDTTDAEGRAATTLTLGEEYGTYSVVATVADLEPLTFTATAKVTPDFDGDGEVGFGDFFLFAEAFGGSDPRFDLDGSGTVDFADFFLFAEAFGQPARARLVAMAREMIRLPDGPLLRQNAPNPFNSGTVISWFQLQPGPARVEVFALTGQRVAVLSSGPHKAGLHRLHWDGRDEQGRPSASGIYLYRLVTAGGAWTRKLTLVR